VSPPDLEFIESLYKAATPEPWHTADEIGSPWNVDCAEGNGVAMAQQRTPIRDDPHQRDRRANAQFIAAMPSIVPQLVERIRAQDAEIARLRGAFATIETWMREGYDTNGCDRWICTPDGVDGSVETRSYADADIKAPSLLELAAAIDAARGA
jgi:hypothetical protein